MRSSKKFRKVGHVVMAAQPKSIDEKLDPYRPDPASLQSPHSSTDTSTATYAAFMSAAAWAQPTSNAPPQGGTQWGSIAPQGYPPQAPYTSQQPNYQHYQSQGMQGSPPLPQYQTPTQSNGPFSTLSSTQSTSQWQSPTYYNHHSPPPGPPQQMNNVNNPQYGQFPPPGYSSPTGGSPVQHQSPSPQPYSPSQNSYSSPQSNTYSPPQDAQTSPIKCAARIDCYYPASFRGIRPDWCDSCESQA